MKKGVLLLVLLVMVSFIGRGANLINENIQSWTAHAAYGTWTQAISAGTVSMTRCMVAPAAAANGTCSIGRVQMESGTGVIELPALSSVGVAEFHMVAGGAGRTIKLQKYNGSTWDDLTTFSGIGTTGATYTFSVNSGTSTILRLASPSAALYVHDIIVTDYINAPTTQTSTISFSNVTASGMQIDWTNGNGSSRAVFVKETEGAITNPVDGTTYTASSDWSSKGTQLGTSGYYCVYNGTGTTVTLTNLSSNTAYYVQAFEYNGTGATSKYYTATATGNPNHQTTASGASPTITLTGSLAAFASTVIGSTSSEQNYSVAGSNLTANISIVPPSGFEISTGTGGSFVATNPVDLSQSGGTVEATTIYVRFAPSSAQDYTGNISHTSAGASTKNQAVSGTGIKAEPTNHVTSFAVAVGSPSYSVITATWTDASGGTLPDKYLIKASATSYDAITAPVDGTPEADATLVKNITQGTQTASFTGLNSSTIYYFKIFPYTNSSADINYKTDGSIPQAEATTDESPVIVNFDDPAKWTAGSVALTSYATNHTYVDGVFSATGGPALRNTTLAQDGFPGALGTYAWRLTNAAATWTITVASGGVSYFSMDIRRWDSDPNPAYNLDYSTDNGGNWTNVTTINNTSLNNSSDWKTFTSGIINSTVSNFLVRLQSTGTTERIMVDNFTWLPYEGPATSTFSGSGNWSTVGNWSNGVPTSITDVTIDGTATIDVVAETKNLTINVGRSVTINNTKSLTVTGTLTNSAGAAGLVINSGGSLIQSSAGVEATVKRDFNAWSSNHGWHLLSSPVSAQNIQPYFVPDPPTANEDFYRWKENNSDGKGWINYKVGETPPYSVNGDFGTSAFVVGDGYLAAYNDNVTKSFSGTINNSSTYVKSLTRTVHDPISTDGWNLVGNPFPSALQWNKASTGWVLTNVNTGIKIWNETDASYTDLTTDGIIPSLQGFFVEVTSGNTTGSLTIPKAACVHHAQPWYKSSENPTIKLLANDPAGQTAQESIIRFIPDATPGFDPDFDSHFLSGYAPLFYSRAGDENLSTNALPESGGTVQIPFDFIRNDGESFSIEAREINGIFGPVILNDLKTGAAQDLTVNSLYTFTSAATDNPDRFLLTFSHVGIGENQKNNAFTVFSANDQIVVLDNTGKNQGNVQVYNMMGQQIASAKLNGNAMLKLGLNVPAGYYLVKVIAPEAIQSSKVFIQ